MDSRPINEARCVRSVDDESPPIPFAMLYELMPRLRDQGLDPKLLPDEVIDKVVQRLQVEGLDPDPKDIHDLFARALYEYELSHDSASTDTLPTVAGMHDAAADFKARIYDVVRALADNPYLMYWLEEYARDHGVDELVNEDAMIKWWQVGQGVERYFANAKRRGGHFAIRHCDEPEQERKHLRRTRTHSRDRVLIPTIVDVLKMLGLQLRAQDDSTWDLEALDAACDVVEFLLIAHGIDAPNAGDTSHGERDQGRLRIAVKAAWSRVDK